MTAASKKPGARSKPTKKPTGGDLKAILDFVKEYGPYIGPAMVTAGEWAKERLTVSKRKKKKKQEIFEEIDRIDLCLFIKIAGADGLISQSEIEMILTLMRSRRYGDEDLVRSVIAEHGKSPESVENLVRQINIREEAEALLEGCTKVALADGEMSPEEQSLIRKVSETLGLSLED